MQLNNNRKFWLQQDSAIKFFFLCFSEVQACGHNLIQDSCCMLADDIVLINKIWEDDNKYEWKLWNSTSKS